MIISLNEEKILTDGQIELERIYDKQDSIFSKKGFILNINDNLREYIGTNYYITLFHDILLRKFYLLVLQLLSCAFHNQVLAYS